MAGKSSAAPSQPAASSLNDVWLAVKDLALEMHALRQEQIALSRRVDDAFSLLETGETLIDYKSGLFCNSLFKPRRPDPDFPTWFYSVTGIRPNAWMSNIEQPKEEQLHEPVKEIISVVTVEKDIIAPTSVSNEVPVIIFDDCATDFAGNISLENLFVLPNDVSLPKAFPLTSMFAGVRDHVLLEGAKGLHFVSFEAPFLITLLGVLCLPGQNSEAWSEGGQFILFAIASTLLKLEWDPPPNMACTRSLHTVCFPTYTLRTRCVSIGAAVIQKD
ncbi:unnamed protein product [Cuscuta campestris]|uniref:Uncharacterized protein n=1 Tax=Cuscuta campestris TaxID=132261 RepID=A0A484L5A7_9ASTE|nr:unnamed protein product [Cuscuta campestris]